MLAASMKDVISILGMCCTFLRNHQARDRSCGPLSTI
jgi:hypothetical protein